MIPQTWLGGEMVVQRVDVGFTINWGGFKTRRAPKQEEGGNAPGCLISFRVLTGSDGKADT